VPPALSSVTSQGVFVYRTIEDLEAIRAYGATCRTGTVLGGGLLGLEAAKALLDLGLRTRVVEFLPRLMPRQLDDGGAAILRARLEALGVEILTGGDTRRVLGNGRMTGIELADGTSVGSELLVISAGIRPRDELARACGLTVGERGGVVVDDRLRTSDASIHAIGEVALHRGVTYGLVGPGYRMADVVASQIAGAGDGAVFGGADTSTTLKLVGVDVSSFGDPFGGADSIPITFEDRRRGVYKKIHLSPCGTRLLGGMLVGDASAYGLLHRLYANGTPCPADPSELILGPRGGASASLGIESLPPEGQVCSCENVCKGAIDQAIAEHALTDVGGIARLTKAGTGCGGCKPLIADVLRHVLESAGRTVKRSLCEHFDYTRQELYALVKVKGTARSTRCSTRAGPATAARSASRPSPRSWRVRTPRSPRGRRPSRTPTTAIWRTSSAEERIRSSRACRGERSRPRGSRRSVVSRRSTASTRRSRAASASTSSARAWTSCPRSGKS
jgi:nitrite reductase (NADH) large subunit